MQGRVFFYIEINTPDIIAEDTFVGEILPYDVLILVGSCRGVQIIVHNRNEIFVCQHIVRYIIKLLKRRMNTGRCLDDHIFTVILRLFIVLLFIQRRRYQKQSQR